MSIFPLPVFEADADPDSRDALSDREIYERLKPPTSIVIRYGSMRAVAEYPYDGPAKPGCGSKLVARTHRGLEVVEMLTTTCSNSGCGKSVSRQEMLEYIENSGGKQFPFRTDGKILRVATPDDLQRWAGVQAEARGRIKTVKAAVGDLGLDMKIVEVEPILSNETLTIYYLSEERVDFRELVRRLAGEFKTRIEMRQVGARDEARLVADYERCGQHCCCKNFLKVLKPVSMRSAKVQKGTVDPLKISGRCGRLMCCLRYEDETYADLKKRLPKNRTRVGTPEGPGTVIDSKILVQLVLVRLEADNRQIAVPVEELCDPDHCPAPEEATTDPFRGADPGSVGRGGSDARQARQARHRERAKSEETTAGDGEAEARSGRRKRRRRRRGGGEGGDEGGVLGGAPGGGEAPTVSDRRATEEDRQPDSDGSGSSQNQSDEAGSPGEGRSRRRRRRRRGGGSGEASAGEENRGAVGSTSGLSSVGSPPDSSEASSGSADASGGGGEGGRKRRRRRRRRGGGGSQGEGSSGGSGEGPPAG